MSNFKSSAYNEAQKHLAAQLDTTSVLSEDFKSILWVAANWMEREAFQRGFEQGKKEATKNNRRKKVTQ